jgi:hypothetical protein
LGNAAPDKLRRKPKIDRAPEARGDRRRDRDGEPVREIARSYNVSAATISRLSVSSAPSGGIPR